MEWVWVAPWELIKKLFPFSSVLVTSLSIRMENVMYFSVLSPKQISCSSDSSGSTFVIKW